MPTPEELARQNIDALLKQCGWTIQKRSEINLSASRGVAITEGLLKGGDEADYLLFVDGKAIGTVEAKPQGFTLTGVEEQSGKYGKASSTSTRSGASRSRLRTNRPAWKRSSQISSIQFRKAATSSPFTNPRHCWSGLIPNTNSTRA
jgi:type I site-specific restriction endonuclease